MQSSSLRDGAGMARLRSLGSQHLPPTGRRIRLSGRGQIFVREDGPEDAPPVVLLHGWVASGGLNWFQAFEPLRSAFRVIAPDLRGHARGIRSLRRFRLEDCADDVAALLETLGSRQPAIAVGYSMGGAVAQLLWKRHRERVAGLVLCATSAAPVAHRGEQVSLFERLIGGAALGTRIADWSTWGPRTAARGIGAVRRRGRPGTLTAWARAEFRRHHWPSLLEAGREITRYDGRDWVRQIDVPTTVVVTERDRAIPAAQQRATARLIPDARVQTLRDGHLACTTTHFGRAIGRACRGVSERG